MNPLLNMKFETIKEKKKKLLSFVCIMPFKEKNNNQSKNLTLWLSLKQECYSSVFPFYFSRGSRSRPFDSVDLTKYGNFRVDPKSSRYSNVWTRRLTLKFLSLNFELWTLNFSTSSFMNSLTLIKGPGLKLQYIMPWNF